MANPYVEQTWTDGAGGGTPLSAARLAVIEQGLQDAHFQPTCRASRSTTLTVVTSTQTTVTMPNESWDQVGGAASTQHDTSTNTNRLTCRVAGIYRVSGWVEWDTNATGVRILLLVQNGTTEIMRDHRQAVNGIRNLVCDLVNLAVNDFMSIDAFQDSGANRTVNSAAIAWERVG